MAAYTLFVEDEICVHKEGKGYSFGLVLGNSEFVSSSEEDDGDDRLQAGTVRVAWHPTGKEAVIAEKKVQLVDRSLMPGDVVRRLIPGQESQCGSVLDMHVCSHLRILRSNKYIYNVNSKDLQPLYAFDVGQEVMLDSWLGRVENVLMDAVLVFSDGAKCSVPEGDLYFFEDKVKRHGKFSESQYFPGQELKGPLASLNTAKWIHSTARHSTKTVNKKGKTQTVNVTIEKIVVKQVDVVWVFRGYEKLDIPDIAISTPARIIEGEDLERLRVLDWFSHCSIQIGDRMLYQVKNDDIIVSLPPSKAFSPKTALNKDMPVKVEAEEDNQCKKSTSNITVQGNNQCVKNNITPTATTTEDGDDDTADFIDESDDGEEDDSDFEEKQPGGAYGGGRGGAKSSFATGGRKKHSLFKGGGVGAPGLRQKGRQPQKAQGRAAAAPKEREVNADDMVEVEVEFNSSFATVMWQDGTVEKDIASVELFPVHHLDEQEFFPGDYILPGVDLPGKPDYGVLVKADHQERTCLVHWFKAYEVGKATKPTLLERNIEMSVYDIKDHPDYKFRPGQSVVRVGGFENLPSDSEITSQATGQIYEVDPNGHLAIKWSNGSISQCYPQEVFIVSDEADESDNESWDSEDDFDSDGSGDSWETDSETEVHEDDASQEDSLLSKAGDENLMEHKQELEKLLNRAETALSRLKKLLNNVDVTVQSPDCFVDIIRIYRSCQDLDKILQSSFFSDSELQSLISQAKLELNRDRVNRITKNLSQVFEQWSKSFPGNLQKDGASANKTIKSWTVRNGIITEVLNRTVKEEGAIGKEAEISVKEEGAIGKETEISVKEEGAIGKETEISVKEEGAIGKESEISSTDIGGAVGGNIHLEAGDQSVANPDTAKATSAVNSYSEVSELRSMKKEYSEPSMSNLSERCPQNVDRRPSDTSVNAAVYSSTNQGSKEASPNLVGENCVFKVTCKRTKSDSCGDDDSGHEVKKSREDAKCMNNTAQELCYKICQNLQMQVVKIQEEVDKRTRRLLNAADSSVKDSQNKSSDEKSNAVSEANVNLDSEDVETEAGDSMPHSMDEAGERGVAVGATDNIRKSCDEGGDAVRRGVDSLSPRIDPGNEASCEESTSQVSLASSDDVLAHIVPCKGFEIYSEVVSFHKYVSQENQPVNPRAFRNCVRKELKLFQSSLPDGIFVKGFENRLDLYSVMILGPEGTPYEDSLFLFDMMLPKDYPTSPPLIHYYSFCSDRLNPNLYEDGKVCVSLLGTWSGKGSEVWTSKSNLLQVLLSIQGLILVREPYFNEAFYEKQRGTQLGTENSRMYNEMALVKTVQTLTRMCRTLPELFKHEIYTFLKCHGPRLVKRLRCWMELNEQLKRHGGNATSKPLTVDPLAKNDIQENQNSECQGESSNAAPNGTDETSYLEDSDGYLLSRSESSSETFGPGRKGEGEAATFVGQETESDNSSATSPQFHSSCVDGCLLQQTAIGSNGPLQTGTSDKVIDKSMLNGNSDHSDSVDSPNFESCAGTSVDGVTSSSSKPATLTDIPDTQYYSEPNSTCVDLDEKEPSPPAATSKPDEAEEPAQNNLAGDCHLKDNSYTCSISGALPAETSLQHPEFPLFPMSRGFCLTLQKHLALYEHALSELKDPTEIDEARELDEAREKEILVAQH